VILERVAVGDKQAKDRQFPDLKERELQSLMSPPLQSVTGEPNKAHSAGKECREIPRSNKRPATRENCWIPGWYRCRVRFGDTANGKSALQEHRFLAAELDV